MSRFLRKKRDIIKMIPGKVIALLLPNRKKFLTLQ